MGGQVFTAFEIVPVVVPVVLIPDRLGFGIARALGRSGSGVGVYSAAGRGDAPGRMCVLFRGVVDGAGGCPPQSGQRIYSAAERLAPASVLAHREGAGLEGAGPAAT